MLASIQFLGGGETRVPASGHADLDGVLSPYGHVILSCRTMRRDMSVRHALSSCSGSQFGFIARNSRGSDFALARVCRAPKQARDCTHLLLQILGAIFMYIGSLIGCINPMGRSSSTSDPLPRVSKPGGRAFGCRGAGAAPGARRAAARCDLLRDAVAPLSQWGEGPFVREQIIDGYQFFLQ